MGIPLSGGNFTEITAEGLRKVFFTDYMNIVKEDSVVERLYTFMPSQKVQEFTLSMSTLADFTSFTTTGQLTYSDIEEGYKQTFTHEEWDGGFQITKKLARDDLYKATVKLPKQNSAAAFRTREKHGMSTFNGAFSGTAGPDSLPLCSTAHTSTVSGVSTQSNSGTETFSKTAVSATRILMMKFCNLSGEDQGTEMNELLLPIDLEQDGLELIKSNLVTESANNNINFHKGRYDLFISRKLTDTNNWFAMDGRLRAEDLLWFNNEDLQLIEDNTISALVKAMIGYMRYSYGWSNWTWIYGHNSSS